MSRLWADGFEGYAGLNDVGLRYNIFGNAVIQGTAATAFALGQAMGQCDFTKTFETATNETTIYASLRLKYNSPVTNAAQTVSMSFYDAANCQCTITWLGDGSIQVWRGQGSVSLGGTLVGAYPNLFTLNVHDSWQFKLVIDGSAATLTMRKNGDTTSLIALTAANLRGGSVNNYANAVRLSAGNSVWVIDDWWVNSDDGVAPTGWPPDVRAIEQVPNGAGGVTAFTPMQNPIVYGPTVASFPVNMSANTVYYTRFLAIAGGQVSALSLNVNTGFTGHLKGALYQTVYNNGNFYPTTLLGTTNEIVNPTSGAQTLTLVSPVTLVRGQYYCIAFASDNAFIGNGDSGAFTPGGTETRAYASGFASPSSASAGGQLNVPAFTVAQTPTNWSLVNEITEDGDATYVQSSNITDKDRYTLTPLGVTASAILGVEVMAYLRKTNSGYRKAALVYRANGSVDIREVDVPLSVGYTVLSKFLPLDPTGVAWTQAHIETGSEIGVEVTG